MSWPPSFLSTLEHFVFTFCSAPFFPFLPLSSSSALDLSLSSGFAPLPSPTSPDSTLCLFTTRSRLFSALLNYSISRGLLLMPRFFTLMPNDDVRFPPWDALTSREELTRSRASASSSGTARARAHANVDLVPPLTMSRHLQLLPPLRANAHLPQLPIPTNLSINAQQRLAPGTRLKKTVENLGLRLVRPLPPSVPAPFYFPLFL